MYAIVLFFIFYFTALYTYLNRRIVAENRKKYRITNFLMSFFTALIFSFMSWSILQRLQKKEFPESLYATQTQTSIAHPSTPTPPSTTTEFDALSEQTVLTSM